MAATPKSLSRQTSKTSLSRQASQKNLSRRSQVADALQSLQVVPPFVDAIGGDILPEAVLLKNILEEMMNSLRYLSTLIYILTTPIEKSSDFGSKLFKDDRQIADLKVDVSNFVQETHPKLAGFMEKLHNGTIDFFQLEILPLREKSDKQNGVKTHMDKRTVSSPLLTTQTAEYDADSEADTSHTVTPRPTLHRRRSTFKKEKFHVSAIPSVEETQTKPEKTEHSKTKSEKDIIHGARCILLAIQNDSSLKKRFITTLDEKAMEINQKIVKMGYPKSSIEAIRARPAEAAFLTMIHEFQQYAVYNIKIPFQARVQEIESLCESIFVTQKYDKSIRKMRITLNDIEESRENQMIQKAKENDSLQNAINDIRLKSRQVIENIKKSVDDTIGVASWKSHARLMKIGEVIKQLKKDLASAIDEHVRTETELRHETNRLENEIQSMIEEYDREMFRRHNDIESISKEYAIEKIELEKALSELKEVEKRKADLLEEKRLEEEAERNEALMVIRRNVAAKTIQRGWRSYKARQLLKKKKHKKKKTAAS